MADFSTGLLIGGIFSFVSAWMFANGNIYPESFNFATKVCESHEGLNYLDEDKTRFSDAVCNNGVIITYDNGKVKEGETK